MKNLNIVTFDSTIYDGQMNTAPAFYPEGMSKEERIKIMQQNKQHIVGHLGISYKNIFIPIQKNSTKPDMYEDGKYYTLTREDVKKYDDLFDFDVYADIVKLTPETPNIAIAYPAADCAVVKAVNIKTNEVTLSHCGGEYIDRYLPMQTIDALGGNEKDIRVYVSPFAHSLFYQDASKLAWANNPKVWDKYKKYNKDSVRVNVYKALRQQLLDRKIPEENLFLSPYDTIASNLFFSHSKSKTNSKYAGRNLFGIAIVDESHDIDESEFIKIIK